MIVSLLQNPDNGSKINEREKKTLTKSKGQCKDK